MSQTEVEKEFLKPDEKLSLALQLWRIKNLADHALSLLRQLKDDEQKPICKTCDDKMEQKEIIRDIASDLRYKKRYIELKLPQRDAIDAYVNSLDCPAEPELNEQDLQDPLFESIWQAIKGWDIEREEDAGYAHATGTDVMIILNAIRQKPTTATEVIAQVAKKQIELEYDSVANAISTVCRSDCPAEPVCLWQLDDEDTNTWKTECDNLWQLTEGAPKENNMLYCPYCGRKIRVRIL